MDNEHKDCVIVPTHLMSKLVAVVDVVLGGGGDGDAARNAAKEAREYINNNGCDYYSLEKEIKSLDTPFKCNMVQWWLENRKWELMKEHIADMKTKMGKK